MRNVIQQQQSLGSTNIADILIDWNCRDDIPQILTGLQHIYITPELMNPVGAILSEVLPQSSSGQSKANPKRGRPGMDQWKIFVLGCLRLGMNVDFDRIHYLANSDPNVRKMLGVEDWSQTSKPTHFSLQTIKDNVRLFTPEILDRINQVVASAGFALIQKSASPNPPVIKARSDSFVVKTNIHFPTDINLLWDAMSKCLGLANKICKEHGYSE